MISTKSTNIGIHYLLFYIKLSPYVLRDKVCQCLMAGRCFSPCTPVSSTNKTERHNITEILLNVALSNIIITALTSCEPYKPLFSVHTSVSISVLNSMLHSVFAASVSTLDASPIMDGIFNDVCGTCCGDL